MNIKKTCMFLLPCACLLVFAGCETIATQSDVDTVKEKVTYVEGDLYATTKAIAERLKTIDETTNSKFSATSEKIDTLSKERAMLAEEISSIKAEIKALNGRLDEIDFKHTEQMKAEKESVQKTEFEVRRDIEGLKKTYADIITSISSLNKNLSAMQTDVLSINRSQVTIADSLNKLSADMEKIREQNAAAEKKMGANMTVFLDELTRQESEIMHLKSIVEPPPEPEAAAAPQVTEKETPEAKTYVVKSGDTLGKIAEKFKTTTSAMKKKNNLKSETVFVGQKLLIP